MKAGKERIWPFWPIACAVSIFVLSVVPSPAWPGARREFFSSLAVHGAHEWLDVVANVVLYLPLGFALSAAGVRRSRALLAGVALTTVAELLQFVIPGRDPSLRDILTNALGTGIGASATALTGGRWLGAFVVSVEGWLGGLLDPSDSRANRMCVGYAIFVGAVITTTALLLIPWAPAERQYVVANATIDSLPGPVIVGASPQADGVFKGLLDDVQIYSEARSEDAIARDSATSLSPGSILDRSLLAAFGFDDDPSAGPATDGSGLRHDGIFEGVTLVARGRHGKAAAFDGTGRIVIPSGASFAIHDGVTLEAWVYFDEMPGAEAPIISQERGAYHLSVSSASGSPRVVGGGVFGGSPTTTRSVESLPLRRWTHVATTYDGESIRVFVNGRLDATRRRWSPHRPGDISLDGKPLPFGVVAPDRRIAPALLRSFVLNMSVTCGRLETAAAPFFLVTSARNIDPLTLVAQGSDILVRNWTVGRAVGLLSPDYRFDGALAGCSQGRHVALRLSGPLTRPQLAVEGRSAPGHGLGLGAAWAFFIHSELLPGWLRDGITVCWLALLLVPFGYFLRRSIAGALAAALIAAALAVVPMLMGIEALSPGQVIGAAGGFLTGALASYARRVTRRGNTIGAGRI